MQPRPTAVTTFGILNLVFAGWQLIGLVFSLVVLLLPQFAQNNPTYGLMESSPVFAIWFRISVSLGFLAALALLAAGIGLLRMRNWGRTLSNGYAIYAVIMSLVGIAMNFIFVLRPMLESASESQGPEAVAGMAGAAAGVFGGCVSLVYPILLLIFMNRRNVVEAFKRASPPPSPSAFTGA